MAIVDMSKISIVGLEKEKRPILNFLMEKGFVQVDDNADLLEDPTFGSDLQRDHAGKELIEIEQKMIHISQSLESVKKYAKYKKGFMAPKASYQFYSIDEADDVFERALKINVIVKDLESAKSERNTVETKRDMLLPWVSLDMPLGELETKYSKTVLGILPMVAEPNLLRGRLEKEAPETILGTVNEDRQFQYVFLVAHKECFDAAMDVMKDFAFLPVTFPHTTKTPSDSIRGYESRMESLDREKESLMEDIGAYSALVGELENLSDYYAIKRDERKTYEKLVKTKYTFCLKGWVPSKNVVAFTQELTEEFDCYIETEAGNQEEGYPILLENNRFVTPFESVTKMYSCPSTKDIDPNMIMSFFYVIFFGMMLSDAGYGVIIALTCWFIVKRGKMEKGEGNLIKLLGLCGVSTTVWGLIFGGAFGDLFPLKALINPLDDVMVLMGMSLLFGIVHIYVGLGIKAYNLIRRGQTMDAIFDVVLWLAFITGVCLLIIPIVAGPIGIFSMIGKYLAIAGAIGLVLTQGRTQKNVLMKGFKGVSSLYDITGYFADILSYSRLMALCLSTGVIGQVINLLGDIAGPIPAIFIGVIGHTANLLINALGAYVHTSRLQYVEFFGKFYEGGGEPFLPFGYQTKYTKVSANKE